MAYEMTDVGYREYTKFCNAEGIEPVAPERYTVPYMHDFFTEHQIANAIWDKNGLKWKDHIELYGSMESYTLVNS